MEEDTGSSPVSVSYTHLTYVLEAFAFLLYFATSFDFANIYTQLYKLLVDVDITLSGLPVAAWIVLGYMFVCWWRKRLGLDKLRHLELCNCGYVTPFGVAPMLTEMCIRDRL